ncbi:DNA ligase 4 [Alternaria panax]|uniref:DNA ligase 4 n=1 Tax=Alternaria panax TaxID=48097 RepID=A0AAD4NSZ5_9PLEO|nr:DNA ligase 4 [Alternaria panax]
MVVFFDVLLVLDDESTLRHCLQDQRKILRDLVRVVPGRSMRSEWTLLDFCQDKTGDGITDLKQTFARNLVKRQEGPVLKPLHAPYFPLLSEQGHRQAGFFIKLKKDYLADMGGEWDLGDFTVIGADYGAQVAPKTDINPLHWTHSYLGCYLNKDAVERTGKKPKFMVVANLSTDKCIPKSDVKYINTPTTTVFKKPFVAEILGGGFEKLQNESLEMLRRHRVKKIHHDRTWEDAVSSENLERIAEKKWEVPDADKPDGHARDVASLVKTYAKKMDGSQLTVTTDDTTQHTTQQTTPRSSPVTLRSAVTRTISQSAPNGAIVQQAQHHTCTTASTSQGSPNAGTGRGTRASRELRILVRDNTPKRLDISALPAPMSTAPESFSSSPPKSNAMLALSNTNKRRSFLGKISLPNSKRKKTLASLQSSASNCHLGRSDYNPQEGTSYIYANKGVKVQVHPRSQGREYKS